MNNVEAFGIKFYGDFMSKNEHSQTVIGYCTCPHVHLIGSSQCVVDGLKGICEYKRERVNINLGKYCLLVVGNGLCINELSPDGAVIEGDILSVEYCGA